MSYAEGQEMDIKQVRKYNYENPFLDVLVKRLNFQKHTQCDLHYCYLKLLPPLSLQHMPENGL
jgi:hypothetical protein